MHELKPGPGVKPSHWVATVCKDTTGNGILTDASFDSEEHYICQFQHIAGL